MFPLSPSKHSSTKYLSLPFIPLFVLMRKPSLVDIMHNG